MRRLHAKFMLFLYGYCTVHMTRFEYGRCWACRRQKEKDLVERDILQREAIQKRADKYISRLKEKP